jgi:hypothetical protein
MKFRKYQARSPQLWSNISNAYYGDRFAYVRIIRYNYETPPFDIIVPENTEIKIPLEENVAASQAISSGSLPPWKR